MVLGSFAFSPAFFLALLIGAGVALFLLRAFHSPANAPGAAAAPASAPARAPAPAPKPEPAPASAAPATPAAVEGGAPQRLDGPREGSADDLKKIKGVGPKLEAMLHGMGFYHYDQIASWSAAEVAWVDENLEGFKGRVSRDNWVEQARTLADGGETEFSQKVDKGDVY
jgi:predicted flap endonuclease-1-like 5' DNA nuclease